MHPPDNELRDNILKLLGLVVKDALESGDPEIRANTLKIAAPQYVQIVKAHAKLPEEDDDENNFGAFQGRLKAIEGGVK